MTPRLTTREIQTPAEHSAYASPAAANGASDWRTRSFWMSRMRYEPGECLVGETACDVLMIGGGFTGLWTAIALKDADPSVDVVLLEPQVVGYGASGRNGGFAMTMVGRNIHDLARKVGASRARDTHTAMVESIREIQDFCEKEQIDADVSAPGLLTVSNGAEQDLRIRQDLDAAGRLGLDDFHELSGSECRSLLHSERLRCGHLEEHSLLGTPPRSPVVCARLPTEGECVSSNALP